MPIVNSQGQQINELSAEDDSDREFIEILRVLRMFEYPRDEEALRHLTYRHFFLWLYGLDPKVALLLTNSSKFRKLQQSMKNKSFIWRVHDRLWRGFHGLDF